jgi:hypothetical protein
MFGGGTLRLRIDHGRNRALAKIASGAKIAKMEQKGVRHAHS